jgi:hypothetical protein
MRDVAMLKGTGGFSLQIAEGIKRIAENSRKTAI